MVDCPICRHTLSDVAQLGRHRSHWQGGSCWIRWGHRDSSSSRADAPTLQHASLEGGWGQQGVQPMASDPPEQEQMILEPADTGPPGSEPSGNARDRGGLRSGRWQESGPQEDAHLYRRRLRSLQANWPHQAQSSWRLARCSRASEAPGACGQPAAGSRDQREASSKHGTTQGSNLRDMQLALFDNQASVSGSMTAVSAAAAPRPEATPVALIAPGSAQERLKHMLEMRCLEVQAMQLQIRACTCAGLHRGCCKSHRFPCPTDVIIIM